MPYYTVLCQVLFFLLKSNYKLKINNKMEKFLKYFFCVILWIILIIASANLGKFIGFLIWKLIMFLGVLPFLEKFFGLFIF